jgi:hypothetical protein
MMNFKPYTKNSRSYHAAALDELRNGEVDDEVWAAAFSRSEGDRKKAESLYVKYRAEQLRKYYEYVREKEKSREMQEEIDRQERYNEYKKNIQDLEDRRIALKSSIALRDYVIFYIIQFGFPSIIASYYYVFHLSNSSSSIILAVISMIFNIVMLCIYVFASYGVATQITRIIPGASVVYDLKMISSSRQDYEIQEKTAILWLAIVLVSVHQIVLYFFF